MTTEELLIPRYEIIADYPNNSFGKVGDIITPQSFESEDDFYDWELDKYPHLFRSLHWAEKREIEELPEYGKTAVQILIERIENQIELSKHNKLGTNRTSDYRIGLQAALGFCFDELEVEKQQIIDAYRASTGCQNPTSERMVALGNIFDKQASDYYNEKYNENTN